MTKLNIVEGDFNNLDAETAVRVCELAGVKREESQKILKNFTLPEGRLEHVDKGQPFKLIIDFAHTPQSLESALRYVRKITKGKIISVFGSAGERDPYKRPEMGRISTQIADVSVVTAEDPRSEDVNKIITEICAGAEEAGAEEINKKKLPDIKPGKASYFIKIPDRDEAIGYAISIAREGDTVCLFGKGHEKSMNLDGVNELPWSDRETSEKYLGANSKNG